MPEVSSRNAFYLLFVFFLRALKLKQRSKLRSCNEALRKNFLAWIFIENRFPLQFFLWAVLRNQISKAFPSSSGELRTHTFLSNFTSVTFALSFIKIHLLHFVCKLPEGFSCVYYYHYLCSWRGKEATKAREENEINQIFCLSQHSCIWQWLSSSNKEK